MLQEKQIDYLVLLKGIEKLKCQNPFKRKLTIPLRYITIAFTHVYDSQMRSQDRSSEQKRQLYLRITGTGQCKTQTADCRLQTADQG